MLLCIAAVTTSKAIPAMQNPSTAPAAPTGDVKVEMTTTLGNVTLLLYGDTPKHLRNFVKLASEGYYDGLLFHRVIRDFMVQGGDPESKDAPAGKLLGNGDPGYKIDAEIMPDRHFHKRGALAAAREADAVNPDRQSSGSQFYVVTGRMFSPGQLDAMEQRMRHARMQEIFDTLTAQNRDTIMTLRRNPDQSARNGNHARTARGVHDCRRHAASRRRLHRVRRSAFGHGRHRPHPAGGDRRQRPSSGAGENPEHEGAQSLTDDSLFHVHSPKRTAGGPSL